MSIPKVIHYCWFGKGEMPKLAKKCIKSWKKYCPDYEIICHNEDNFDCFQNRYMSEAYQAKKWAFVSDYARLKIIYDNGGIYLDTDVEIIKPIDDLLRNKGFMGFDEKGIVATGLGFGAEKGNEIIGEFLKDYNNYIKENPGLKDMLDKSFKKVFLDEKKELLASINEFSSIWWETVRNWKNNDEVVRDKLGVFYFEEYIKQIYYLDPSVFELILFYLIRERRYDDCKLLLKFYNLCFRRAFALKNKYFICNISKQNTYNP